MRQPIQVLVYVVRRHQGGDWQYLLLRRVPDRGRFWQGITGGAEEGENLLQAATRELAEETQLTPLTLEKADFHYSFPMEERWRHLYKPGTEAITEYVFIASVGHQDEPVLSPEHDGYEWCEFEQALGKLTWPNNVEALRQCQKVVLTWK